MAVAFDYSKLKGRIIEKFDSRSAFAHAVNMRPEQLSRRLNNQTPIKSEEVVLFVDLLGIEESEIYSYFFTPKVR